MFQLTALSSQLTFDITTANADGYIQALPDGEFAAVDGRPSDVKAGKWLMDTIAFTALKANTPHQAGDLVIDYEHQTLNKDKNGQPAPAAGWFNIDDVQYRQGQGLFIKPRFTDNATAYLSAGEYKYFSLVFGYDTDTGRPQYIHSAALTNRPGVDGMLPLATLCAQLNAAIGLGLFAQTKSSMAALSTKELITQPEDLHVNPLLQSLLTKLGIEFDANAAELSPELQTAALAALDELTTTADSVDGLNQKLVALSATQTNNGGPDLSQFVPAATYNAMREQLVSLTAENGKLTIEQTVKTALDDGRILACEQDYLLALGKQQGMAALSAHLDGRQPINALTTKQTTTVDKPTDKSPLAALTADEKQMADAWGMSHDDFAKAKASDKEHN